MAVTSNRPPANGFVRVARKVYHPVGFSKGYNFVLWFIFTFAMVGFVLARLPLTDFNGQLCSKGPNSFHAAPGECFNYLKLPHERVGIIMHLVTVLPAGLLACVQFIPAVRHRALLLHRINGYLVLLLSVAATIGALMIVRHSFGGGLEVQTFGGLLSIAFLGSLLLAYINIKRLQLEQHRAWMLRAWFYASSIITLRLIMIIGSTIITTTPPEYYSARPCDQVVGTLGLDRAGVLALYPGCEAFFSGKNPNQHVTVAATLNGNGIEAATALGLMFGVSMWLAGAIHAVGVEVYLRLTPAESERLRNVSYQRQVEAGMKHPGRAGLTADRLGDADEWVPEGQKSWQRVKSSPEPQGDSLLLHDRASSPRPYTRSPYDG